MSARQKAILAAIIEIHIETGTPVSSKLLANHIGFQASPATIRAEMAWLFEMGYLEQPHTSAGRIPSHLGYREYIDFLMNCRPITQDEKNEIDSLFNVRNIDPDKFLTHAADALSEYTGTAAIASSITPESVRVKRVELIAAGPHTVVILLMASNGAIKNKVCRVPFLVTVELLEFFNKFANSRLSGRSLGSITSGYIGSIAVTLDEYAMIFNDILAAIYDLCLEVNEGQYYLSGETKLIEEDDTAKSTKDLLNLLRRKDRFLALFTPASADMAIRIGKENTFIELADSVLVATPYKVGSQRAGIIGLIGPIRLDYAKILPHLEYFAKTLSDILSDTLDEEQQ